MATSIGARSPWTWLDKRLRSGGARTRALYAGSRRLWLRRELARRRRLAGALAGDASLAIPRERGFLALPPGRVPGADAVARATRMLTDAALRAVAPGEKKPQLLYGLVAERELALDSPFLRFALHPEALRCVSDYLGAVPLLASVDVWASLPSSELGNSQLFHCDWADLSQVKVFVYGSDVGRESGPLVVLGASTSQRLRERLGYRWGGQRYRVTDAEASALGAEGDQHEIVGPAGSVAFVDTCRCFHYGSRITSPGVSRSVCVLSFVLPSAFSVPADARERRFRHLASGAASELERLVLGGER